MMETNQERVKAIGKLCEMIDRCNRLIYKELKELEKDNNTQDDIIKEMEEREQEKPQEKKIDIKFKLPFTKKNKFSECINTECDYSKNGLCTYKKSLSKCDGRRV